MTPLSSSLIRRRRDFAARLLRWYAASRRDLPWRRERAPYRILVSEVMLQQTRADVVIPYYRRFLRAFPSFRALARAPREDVLSVWEGLGYYRRARDLQRTARLVSAAGGRLPRSAAELVRLPGIGPYTAGAVASIAFDEPEPVLDGNVERVIARLLARPRPPPRERDRLRGLLRALIPASHPGDFNQALMELGATVCTPRRPACGSCPLRGFCAAFACGDPEAYPRRLPRRPVPLRREEALLVRWNGRLLLRKRLETGLLGGLWGAPSYPGGGDGGRDGDSGPDAPSPRSSLSALRHESGVRARCDERLPELRHAFSHFTLVLVPLACSPRTTPPSRLPRDWRWFSPRDLDRVPMGKADRTAIAKLGAVG